MQNENDRMAELRARFRTRLARDRDEIAEALAAADHARARHLAHGLAGLAGSFGHAALGDAAYELEQAIENNPGTVNQCWKALKRLTQEASHAADVQP